jgi:hypothetical protein
MLSRLFLYPVHEARIEMSLRFRKLTPQELEQEEVRSLEPRTVRKQIPHTWLTEKLRELEFACEKYARTARRENLLTLERQFHDAADVLGEKDKEGRRRVRRVPGVEKTSHVWDFLSTPENSE